MTGDSTSPGQPPESGDDHVAADAAATQFINEVFRGPDRVHFINTENDRFITLLLANLSAFDDEQTNTIAGYAEFILFAQYARLHKVFESRKYAPKKQRYVQLLRVLRNMEQLTNTIIRLLALGAIEAKAVSRRDVAEALGVHENTVARWVKEGPAWNRPDGKSTGIRFNRSEFTDDPNFVFIDIGPEFDYAFETFLPGDNPDARLISDAVVEAVHAKTPAIDILLENLRRASFDLDKGD